MNNRLTVILTSDVSSLLVRDLKVTLDNISRGGCLLVSSVSIHAGTIAMLRLTIRGSVFSDAVRVTRSWRVPGAGERHHIGVEFLQLDAPGPQSLRAYATAATSSQSVPPDGASVLRFEGN